jgi:alpha-glucosidase
MDDRAGGRWWQGAVLYQVYVRSFQDTDGDGYGDLRGVTERLDYLAWLGADGIWLSPTMPSPDDDWGYDVSDYLGVHPGLGTMEDLDRLIAEAGARGLRVLLDLVPNHTSTAHPWFVDAASGRGSEHRGYYLWADPAPGGGPPNNWRSATGGSAWAWHEPTGQYYMHSFLPTQADLNWREPAVHQDFQDILRFWFDRGVAGFRIDVAHGLYKDAQLRDDPPAEGASWLDTRAGMVQVHSANQPESHGLFRDWRRIADGYAPPRLLLGETWTGDLARLAGFYGHDDELQLAFNFPFLFAPFTARGLSGVVGDTLAALPAGAAPVWTASNHDVGRLATHWCWGDQRKIRLALLVLATLPGTTVLYFGDEIGMTNVEVPPALLRDTMRGADSTRDRGRTPMQWDASPSGGFTGQDVTPWLPLGDTAACNVADQRDDPASVLSLCRALLRLRRAELGGSESGAAGGATAAGGYQLLQADDHLWAYRTGRLTVAANLSDEPASLPIPLGDVVLTTGAAPLTTGGAPPESQVLQPWQGVIAGPAT